MSGTLRQQIVHSLVHGHFLLAIGAIAQTWWIGTFTQVINVRILSVVGVSVLATYGAMRLVRTVGSERSLSPTIQWVSKHRSLMIALVLVSVAVGSWAVSGVHRVFEPWDMIALPIVALYLTPVRNELGLSRGLRRIPLLKAFLIALVWALATTGFSVEELLPGDHVSFVPFLFIQFCYFLSITIASDLVDLRHDEPSLRTIPQVFGVRVARVVAVIALMPGASWMFFMLMLYSGPRGPEMHYLLPLVGYFITGLIVAGSGPSRPDWYGPIVLDGALMVIPVLYLLGGP